MSFLTIKNTLLPDVEVILIKISEIKYVKYFERSQELEINFLNQTIRGQIEEEDFDISCFRHRIICNEFTNVDIKSIGKF